MGDGSRSKEEAARAVDWGYEGELERQSEPTRARELAVREGERAVAVAKGCVYSTIGSAWA